MTRKRADHIEYKVLALQLYLVYRESLLEGANKTFWQVNASRARPISHARVSL